jgi:hypothetical protein
VAGRKDAERAAQSRKREAALHIDAEMRDHADAEDRAFEQAIDEWKGRHLTDADVEDSEGHEDPSGSGMM